MKEKLKYAYMETANVYAGLSNAIVLKVGCVLVKNNRIISDGVNGTPSGHDNNCEDPIYLTEHELDKVPTGREIYKNVTPGFFYLKTKAEVLHAESNCIAKVARSHESSEGATLFTTHSPCMECAKLIYQAGIVEVYYQTQYRDDSGISFLRNSGIIVQQL